MAPLPSSRSLPAFTLALGIVVIFTIFEAHRTSTTLQSPAQDVHFSSSHPREQPNLPDIVIFRRTRKTGSSSLLDQLILALQPLGYHPLYASGTRLRTIVRAELLRPNPRRLLVAEHNFLSRADVPDARVVIVDSIADGYKQMTSFCRYVAQVKVSNCTSEVADCLTGPIALKENTYRWGGRTSEDDDTYIDLPLSVEHVALSNTIFRNVFPDAVLNIQKLNVAGSACEEFPALRKVYDQSYRPLHKQIDALRKRMLVLAGYPTTAENSSVSVPEMLDAADALEKHNLKKQGVRFGEQLVTRSVSKEHTELKLSQMKWVSEHGRLVTQSARTYLLERINKKKE